MGPKETKRAEHARNKRQEANMKHGVSTRDGRSAAAAVHLSSFKAIANRRALLEHTARSEFVSTTPPQQKLGLTSGFVYRMPPGVLHAVKQRINSADVAPRTSSGNGALLVPIPYP